MTPSEAPQAAPAATVVDVERLGGEAGIARWVQRFYEKVAREPVLAPMFEDLERAQAKQIAYFVELFGGPKRYSEQYGPPFLRFKHRAFRIGQPERDAWMLLAMEALRECGAEEAVLAEVERKLSAIADAMVNHHPQRHDPYYFQR